MRGIGGEEAQHVGEVVAGVGDERDGMTNQAEDDFGHDDPHVQQDGGKEGQAERGWGVVVSVARVAVSRVTWGAVVMIMPRVAERRARVHDAPDVCPASTSLSAA